MLAFVPIRKGAVLKLLVWNSIACRMKTYEVFGFRIPGGIATPVENV